MEKKGKGKKRTGCTQLEERWRSEGGGGLKEKKPLGDGDPWETGGGVWGTKAAPLDKDKGVYEQTKKKTTWKQPDNAPVGGYSIGI